MIMEKEIKIIPPEGYEIDKENSTFECIKFKPIQPKPWRYDSTKHIAGWKIAPDGSFKAIAVYPNFPQQSVFATKKQAKSALAMAQISQIMANDERFGGPITNEEWEDENITKYIIKRVRNSIFASSHIAEHSFLAFHTGAQRDLFSRENWDLIRQYFMLN